MKCKNNIYFTIKKQLSKITMRNHQQNNTPPTAINNSCGFDPDTSPLKNTLLSLDCNSNIDIKAHYNSGCFASGLLGTGWHLDFEKHIEINKDNVLVYDTPAIFSVYTPESASSTRYTCCDANKNGYTLTVDYSNHRYPYIIDCNSERTEYYNTIGRISKIVDPKGIETSITYSKALITITDVVSGKKIYLEKDSNDRVTRIYYKIEYETLLEYTDDLLTSVRNVNGDTIVYEYDKDKRIVLDNKKNSEH